MSPALARQLFPMIFPDVICAQMSGTFAQAVADDQASRRVPRRMPARHLRATQMPERVLLPVAAAAVA
jgi:hypothetical protein